MATTTIRIDYDTLPEQLDCRQPDAAAADIRRALRADGIAAEASDLLSHLTVEVPTAQLAAASAVLAGMQLIRMFIVPARRDQPDAARTRLADPAAPDRDDRVE